MPYISFADVVHQNITFSTDRPPDQVALALCDNPWLQRLRDVSQTANTRLVFMFAEHTRFGHCLGAAHLAVLLLERLEKIYGNRVAPFSTAVAAAAMLHDVGHIAPGSHTAFKTWFPHTPDQHEEIACNIVRNDESIQRTLNKFGSTVAEKVLHILQEGEDVPPWTWELISGGGWNVDRGNWCVVDSVMAGVSYGKYNIPALMDSLVLTQDDHLALRENRLDAMMHFVVSRHAMYRQVYQHRVLLAADMLNAAIAQRARDLGSHIEFADSAMTEVLNAPSALDLSLDTIFRMRESWWRYHLGRWSESGDQILADLSYRLLNRNLFKTVRVQPTDNEEQLYQQAKEAVTQCGFDPRYYLHRVSTIDVHAGDSQQPLRVVMADDSICPLGEADPLFNTLVRGSQDYQNVWLVLPAEAKALLGRQK